MEREAIAVEASKTAKILNIVVQLRWLGAEQFRPSLNAPYGLVVAPLDVEPVAPAAAAPLPPVAAAAVLADAGAAELPFGDEVLETPLAFAPGLPLPTEVLTAPKPVA